MEPRAREHGRLALAIVAAACVAATASALVATPAATAAAVSAAEAISRAAAQPSELFVRVGPELRYQPLAVFPSATLVRLGVPQPLALRLPSAVAAVAAVMMTFVLAVRITRRPVIAAAAASMLLLMPGFRTLAATPGGELLLAPLLLTWLLSVLAHLDRPRAWWPILGGAALATCAYTQPAGVLAVPIFFALGAVLLWRSRRGPHTMAAAAIACGATLAPAAIWLLQHPDAYSDTFGRWAIHAAHVRDPLQGLVAFTRWHVVARRVGEYWHYFNPTFLFGGQVYGCLFAVLVPPGLLGLARIRRDARRMTIAAWLLTPVSAVLLDVPRAAGLVPLWLPLGALAAALAVDGLRELTHRTK